MTDYLALASAEIRSGDTYDPHNLEPQDVLELVQRYYAERAAGFWENYWRRQISTLVDEDPLVSTMLTAEWLIKGPEALKVIAGGHSEIIATEAAIITMFNPDKPTTEGSVAEDIAERFKFWVAGGTLLTAIRRATQHLIYSKTTPRDCEEAFLAMKEVADEVVTTALAGSTKEAILYRISEMAATV